MATNVLIVDDEASVRRLMGLVLERNGYCCTLAESTAEALQRLQELEFGIALLDVNIGQESGLDLARIVCRAHPATAVLMVTGHNAPEILNAASEIGAVGCVSKPFKPNDLLAQVADALRRRSACPST